MIASSNNNVSLQTTGGEPLVANEGEVGINPGFVSKVVNMNGVVNIMICDCLLIKNGYA